MIYHFVSAFGFLVFAGIAWLLSTDRRKVSRKTLIWGLSLQLAIGLLIFRVPLSHRIFLWLNDAVLAVLNASKSGTAFLFGPLAASPGETGSVGFILIFQVLPVAIFFSALTSALYHLRVLQVVVRLFAKLFHRTMKISGAESLCGAANIFVGVESALVIRPYLEKMTRSELLTVLTTGMATVASSTLGIYVAFLSGVFPQIAGHLLSASVLAIPAAIVMTKLLIPETETPETLTGVPPEDQSLRSRNLMSAIIQGAMDGLKLAAGISALLIAILGLVALGDKALGLAGSWMGMAEPLSLVRILSWIFYPLTFLLGVQPSDVPEASRLLGERVILTEVVSYQDLAQLVSSGKVTDPRTVVIVSYALCGFAHVASVAIFVGGTAALAPSRRDDLASLGWRALLAATLATLMTGCVAGMFSSGEGVGLLMPGP
ncbi:MAG TPA: nucleoside transporter C-terminal domain-containing protein [Blastocatellia bacterium]|nr:nucleoside transporter C-terminal domain-containing protein [Blastocatellia bacterium]